MRLETAYGGADDGVMSDVAVTVIGGVVILAVTGVVIYLYQRSLDKPGGREGLGQVGDMFGGLIEVFNPGEARARDGLSPRGDSP